MWILWTFLVGLVVGAIAKFLLPGRDPGGFFVTALIGVAGSFVAAYLGRMIGWYSPGQGPGLIGSIVGAMVLLVVFRLVFGRRRA